MSTAAKHAGRKTAPKPIPPDEVTEQVNAYLSAKATIKAAERVKDDTKAYLLTWLGPESCKTLTDGRVVSKITSTFPAQTIERKAYTSQMLVVSGPPA